MTATQTRPARPRAATKKARPSGTSRLAPYLLILPAVVILLFALGYPLYWQIVTSMQSFGLAQQFGQPPEFVGLENYASIFGDAEIWWVILRSLIFCVVNAALTVLIGTLLALLMNAVGKIIRLVLQIAMLIAWAMPVVATMTIFVWLFDWYRGVVNYLLGPDFAGHNWLQNPLSFYGVATIIVVWMSVPFVSFSVYAGLTQVDTAVIEAAQIDGATGSQRFFHIIMPIIRPVMMIVLLLQLIWDLRVFTQIRMLQDAGATPSETDLLGTFIYRIGVGSGDFGMASAMSIFVLLLTIVLSAYYVFQLLKEDN
ncbi:MAG: sugar ABC transporter permease [Propionicimonas sp.]|nr:sugar ABC transporter permease [Propionicimonas sp.]